MTARTRIWSLRSPSATSPSARAQPMSRSRIESKTLTCFLDGIYDRLLVTSDHSSTAIINETPTAKAVSLGAFQNWKEPVAVVKGPNQVAELPPSAESAIAPVGIPESLQTMHAHLRVSEINRELVQLEARVRDLTRQLGDAHRAGRATNLSVLPEMSPSPFLGAL